MAHTLLANAADNRTAASDGGSGVLIVRGVIGRLLRKSGQPNKVPLASKTSTDSADVCFAVPGFHLPMRLSTKPFLSTPQLIQRKGPPPEREAENAGLVSFGYDLSETHMALFLSYFFNLSDLVMAQPNCPLTDGGHVRCANALRLPRRSGASS
jgi:hypothetical protein